MGSGRQSGRLLFVAASFVFAIGQAGAGDPFPQASPAERALIAAGRAAAQAQCDCAGAGKHGAYMRCVAQAVKAEVAARRLSKKQMHQVMKCAARSTCGRAGTVTCCKTNRRARTKCVVMPAARCTAPRGGSACATGFASWCDATEQGCAPAQVDQDTQCCLATSPGGAILDNCELLKPDECATEGGVVVGDGTCDPNPCPPIVTTTTTTTGTTATTGATTTTTSTTLPGTNQCCLPTSVGGAFDQCQVLSPDQCAAAGGQDAGPGSCDPNPCPLGRCGDGVVQPDLGEQCDPPWSRNSDHCPPLAGHRFGPECGDNCRCVTTSVPSTSTTSTTLPGTTTTTTTEPATTTTTTTIGPVCGNSQVEGEEECDPPGSTVCPPASPGGSDTDCEDDCTCPGATALIEAVTAGATVLQVGDMTGFDLGDTIRINPGGANEEDNTIGGFGSLILGTPLAFDHAASEAVVELPGGLPTTTTTTETTSTSTTSTTTAETTTTTVAETTTTLASTTTTSEPTTTTSTSTTTSTTTTTEPTTTTTTSTTTQTTTPPTTLPTKLAFTTTAGTANCGGAGLGTPPAAPLSGQLASDTSCTTKVSDLGLGCLYFGGGGAAIVPPGGIPDQAKTVLAITGPTTLGPDAGSSSKDCSRGAGPARHCVNNNSMPACTGDAGCGGIAGACALDANCFFGPPLPIRSPVPFGALTTCVLNVIQSDASGTMNPATGESSVGLPLSSRVYITGNTASPCPKCIANTCDPTWRTSTNVFSPDAGAACTPTGASMTTSDCRPTLPGFQAPLGVDLTPLTTGTASRTSATGSFCPGQNNPGAFGKTATRCVQETGSPAGDLSDGAPHQSILASVFCIPATGNPAVDGVADLPGPGALGLNGNTQLQ